jgi:hypothetical protein
MSDPNVPAILVFADGRKRRLLVAEGTTEVRLPYQEGTRSLREAAGGPLGELLKRPSETIFLFEGFNYAGDAVFYESGSAI